jgi:hypothetical protein
VLGTASAILIIKIGFLKARRWRAFKKPGFGVSSAFGVGNTKIGYIMRIAGTACFYVLSDTQIVKL